MFFCVETCHVSHFSWGGLICHCLQISIPLFFAQTRSFCSFFFFFNALHIQKRQHVGILKRHAPPWLHESSFYFLLILCVFSFSFWPVSGFCFLMFLALLCCSTACVLLQRWNTWFYKDFLLSCCSCGFISSILLAVGLRI